MGILVAWICFSSIGFLVAVVGAPYARSELIEAKKDYAASKRIGSRILALDQLRQRKTTYARLIIFAVVMAGYVAVGYLSTTLPPAPDDETSSRRAAMAFVLIGGEAALVIAKTMDLYTLYQQKQVRRRWRSHKEAGGYEE